MSKRDEAKEAFEIWIRVGANNDPDMPWTDDDIKEVHFVVDLIVDAAKEEIRAELAEQAEERRWHALKAMVDGSTTSHWLGGEFVEEWRALRAKREAAGKSTD
jgi:hypothetical protein